MYYTYMLRCKDNSIYTGITTNLNKRIDEHITKGKKCAKYTLTHTVIGFEAAWETEGRSSATKLEYFIKHLSKKQKEDLINYKENLNELLINKGINLFCKRVK